MGRGVAAKPRPPQGVPGVGRSVRPGRGLALAPALAPAGPGDRGGAARGNRGRARAARKRGRKGRGPRGARAAVQPRSPPTAKVNKTYSDSRRQGTPHPPADFEGGT